jgi:proteasome lid subunit RPN8/RPN11
MPETALFPEAVVAALRRALHAAAPREFVGLLGGSSDGAKWTVDAFLPLPNAARGVDAFAVAPAAFAAAEAELRAQGRRWLGFAHGHPTAPAVPSQRDVAAFWPGCLQAIVGPCDPGAALRCYWRDGTAVREVAVRAARGEAVA